MRDGRKVKSASFERFCEFFDEWSRGKRSADEFYNKGENKSVAQVAKFLVPVDEMVSMSSASSPSVLPPFRDIIQRYHAEGVVFLSPKRGSRACDTMIEVDDTGFSVERLTANEPQRCTCALLDDKLKVVQDAGGHVPYVNDFPLSLTREHSM